MARHQHRPFAYIRPPELNGADSGRRGVIIVGAGPVGLTAAIDLALRGIPATVLDDNDVVCVGSRAICWSKRTLEIFDRLGVGRRMLEKGVTWKLGRVFRGDRELYSFDLVPEAGHRMPAYINLQRYHVEQYLVERCGDFPALIELRWNNRVTGIESLADGVRARIDSPDGSYALEADWLIACDGVRSAIRSALGLQFLGKAFEERFLLADVEMKAGFPSERRFWFEPTFHDGQSALLHKQPDDIYRIDLQLGAYADQEAEKHPDRVIPRIRAMVGERAFELDWVSVYTFQCQRLAKFVHGRVIFAGDSAHVVSPFGARGGNGGIQDVDNLVWKLAMVIRGEAPLSLIDTYDEERVRAADENIRHASRSTNFMVPKSEAEAIFSEAVLDLAERHPFARHMVNFGRLSTPCVLSGSSLQTPAESGEGVEPGSVCPDARVADRNGVPSHLLDHLGGRLSLLAVGDVAVPDDTGLPLLRVGEGGDLTDAEGLVAERYGQRALYVVRPDQHVAARLADPSRETVMAACARAAGRADAAAKGAAA